MLVLGLHPVEDAPAAGRGAERGTDAPGAAEAVTAELDPGAVLAWRDFMVSTTTTRPGEWLARTAST